MASSNSGKYIRGLTKLKFRDKASIKLPKTGAASILNRETCYKIAIDVIIESVTKPEYRNFQTTPYHGFYGYATLVMRDCIAPKIQLQFGRNRIFEQRIVEAFQGWNDLAFYLQTTKRFLELLANSLRTGEPPSFINNLCDVEAFSFAWSEIDLREVYVLCPEKTQFRIELSWVSPEKFTDDCGKEQNGKSKEPDDQEKDSGLPENGTEPKKNDASNPFAGNNPVTSLGSDSPYFNPKGENLNNPNPDNSVITPPPSAGQKVVLGASWISSFNNGVPVLLSESGLANPFPTDCQIGALITSLYLRSEPSSRGEIDIIEFKKDGALWFTAQFLGSTSDFSIQPCN